MTVTVKCKCGATLTVKADMAGRMGTCPRCGRTMRIPEAVSGDIGPRPGRPHPYPYGSVRVQGGPSPVHIRWPRAIVGPLAMAAAGVLVLATVVVAAILTIPLHSEEPEHEELIAAREYLNPKYGYRFVVPAAWKIAEENPDNLILNGRSDSSIVSVEVRQGGENSREFLEALSAGLREQAGFKIERKWSRQGGLNRRPFQLVYAYEKDGERWKAMVRVFRFEGRWLVITFRALKADYRLGLREFEEMYRSIKTAQSPE